MKKIALLLTVALVFSSVSLYAQSAQTRLDNGKRFFDQGNYDGAIQELNEAIKLDSNLAEAYAYRSWAYGRKNNNDQALSDANRAIWLNPRLAMGYFARGRLQSDNDSAIADYTEAIRLDPKFAWAYVNRGIAYYNKNDYDRAIADYTEAIRLDPKDALAYNNRGWAYYNKNNYDSAIADFEAAIRIEPNFSLAKINLDVARRGTKMNPDGFDRSKYKQIKVEDFSFDMVSGKFPAGTKVVFSTTFLSKPTGTTYVFNGVYIGITLKTTHNFARDMPDSCFFSLWGSQDNVSVYVTVKKPGQYGECSVDIIEW
jgi:tetratricopeptide (TPR) repeat protein